MVLDTSSLLDNTTETFEQDKFDFVKIGLSSPARILSWSHGEVTKPETINYRTLKPERDGLFCEKIFGPAKDWECHCGKYKRVRHKGIICERCGVEVTDSKVRRHRMGHIKLAAPVAHIWYLKGIPSHMSLLLDMSMRAVEDIAYYNCYVVIDPKDLGTEEKGNILQKKQILTEEEYENLIEEHGVGSFEADMGAPALKKLLADIKLQELSAQLREEIKDTVGQKRTKLIKRLRVVENFLNSGAHPTWMILDCIPVIPPDLRPMVQLDGGRFATSDLNDLYRRVINRNNRLNRLLEMEAPDIIIRNEKRMLQEAVDALIDNGRRGRTVVGPNNRPLKSLSDIIEGKQGRFRQNLLGKRVDYSGRSVIVVGPTMKLHQCGLPKEMALELFKPFVMNKLVERGIVQNIKSAKKKIERQETVVWDVLEDVIKGHPILLNRAPTLHRLGIQAFEPILVEGRAIQLHPLVCSAFNADFDGDQMAVHVPLSIEAQTEARLLMLATNNILLPATGKPTITPTQDMVLGCYYLTVDNPDPTLKGTGKIFSSLTQAVTAYQAEVINIHAKIIVRIERTKIDPEDDIIKDIKTFKDSKELIPLKDFLNKYNDQRKIPNYVFINTTVGRIIFNSILPKEFYFINKTTGKKEIAEIISKCYLKYGNIKTAEIANSMKDLGFKYSTKAGISISVDDLVVPDKKKEIVKKSEEENERARRQYQRGEITEVERYAKVLDTWNAATEEVTNLIKSDYDRLNSVYMMAFSGARGNISQVRQLVGMRGLMADPAGRIIDLPIKTNFKEGLTVTEYIISSYGARKGLVDTALRTADSGYLTRRLADVAQDVIVQEEDCGTKESILIKEIRDGETIIVTLGERLVGRVTAEDIYNPNTKEMILSQNSEILPEHAEKIIKAGITEVKIRSPLTCQCRFGVCRMCYGWSLTNNRLVDIGEAVGIIAAQSIGEPGTQLTMRTFHTGGVFSSSSQKTLIKAPLEGKIKIGKLVKLYETRTKVGETVKVTEKESSISIIGKTKTEKIIIPINFIIKVENGQSIKEGEIIAESLQETGKTARKSREKGFKEIIAAMSGLIKFEGFTTEEKKDRQGVTTKVASREGVIWIINGEVYTLPAGSEITVKNQQKVRKGTTLARIATVTEYGGRVKLNEDSDRKQSISVITADIFCPDAIINTERKDTLLIFPEKSPIRTFQLFCNEGGRVENNMIIAEALHEKYVVSTSGEIRYVKLENTTEKQPVTQKTQLMFLPEIQYPVKGDIEILVEDTMEVEEGTEILPGIKVKESGVVSLENLDLSQSISFYPGARAYLFPLENANIIIEEGTRVKKNTLIGQRPNPENNDEMEDVYSEQEGIVQFVNGEEGIIVVIRVVHEYNIEPVKKFYKAEATNKSIDIVPITRILVRDGDKIKAGSSMVKVQLQFKLNSPLTSLGGRVEFVGDDENKRLKIVVVETLSLRKIPQGGLSRGKYDLDISSTLLVKDNEVIPPKKIVAYTEYSVPSDGIVEIPPVSPNEPPKILLTTPEHEVVLKVGKNEVINIKEGEFIHENTAITNKIISKEAGFVYKIEKDKIILRRARPYLISQGSQLVVDNGAMVQQGEDIAILYYDQIKTGDIIQGLPRVEELLEARKPKEVAILSEYDGIVNVIHPTDDETQLFIIDENGVKHEVTIPSNAQLMVANEQEVKKGDRLTDGPINPHDLLRISGIEAVQRFLVDEVQSIYRSQGVEISDKHIEIIVRQMTRKSKIESSGDTILLPGEIINNLDLQEINNRMKEEGKEPAIGSPTLLGITKASLNTDSFISAASFQETTRVLTEAAIEGKKDYLRGLKENVIIGRLIPAGTGMSKVEEEAMTEKELIESKLI